MKRLHKFAAGLGCLGWLLAAVLTRAANLPTDWPLEQTFAVATNGLIKLDLPVETLGAARPALEDLRLYDDAGNEISYLIEYPAPVRKTMQPVKSFQVTLNANSTVINLDPGLTTPVDGVTLETPAADFIKAVNVEGSLDGATWQNIAQGQPVFRQPFGASQLRIPLPAGAWRRLQIIVDDRRSPPVPITGARVHTATDRPAPEESVPVEITERDENPGETRLALNLAGANLNLASVQIETTEPLFMRQVSFAVPAIAENSIREQIIGGGTAYRVAVEGQAPAENLTVPVETAVRSRELFVLIKNGDSRPLTISAVRVNRHPVYLIFLAAQAGSYHLLSGNRNCPSPHYDLAALGMNLQAVGMATVNLPPPSANPDYRAPEVLPGIGEKGSRLDTADWKYRKPVQISSPGVQQLDLDLEVLAHTEPGFADLRLLHGSNQVPYILERTSISRPLATSVTTTNDPKNPGVSRWILKLPQNGLPLTRLTCEAQTSLFKRSLSLYEILTDEQGDKYHHELGQATWTQTPDRSSKEFTLALETPPQSDTLFLETENGDNPPVELGTFQMFYPLTRILFKAESGDDLFLYYGNPAVPLPDYDLSLVANQLLAAKKTVASLSGGEQLKKPSWQATQMSAQGSMLFWGILAVVVVVLLIIISRLLPKSPSTPQ